MNSLGDRIKQYERSSLHLLVHRMPVIVRVDGRCFSSFTRGCGRTFDPSIMDADKLEKLCVELGLSSQDIDDTVYDIESEEASNINNEGMHAQLLFIIESWGEEETEKLIRELAAQFS